ncbi:MAG TPA: hypothetical protein VL860_14425 [Planctomycetota bacterium]|jgi:hypothetical protein|nr:hypothetical protein [Planctomycetota bacterium]
MGGLIPGVENIGKRERHKRLIGGIVMFVFAAGLAVVLFVKGAAPAWRLTVGLPVFLGMLCVLEFKAKTCVMHAARGTCNMDVGDQKINDATLQGQLNKVARNMTVWSIVAGVAAGGVLALIPV